MRVIDRIHIIVRVVQESPKIGKTAIMKCLYLIQTLKNVPLNYEFEIYTYGPYSSAVMDEIDCARQMGLINVYGLTYPSGQFGYSIECSEQGKKAIEESKTVAEYSSVIDDVTLEFGNKTAVELELLSTILFVYKTCDNKSETDVCTIVQGIKPKFSLEEIREKFKYMQENKHLC
ncbi:MAG: hypothetical protein IJQ80_01585 [Clostridia bacterium]|nr:hypothetical protein [Clostridia bacterium]